MLYIENEVGPPGKSRVSEALLPDEILRGGTDLILRIGTSYSYIDSYNRSAGFLCPNRYIEVAT